MGSRVDFQLTATDQGVVSLIEKVNAKLDGLGSRQRQTAQAGVGHYAKMALGMLGFSSAVDVAVTAVKKLAEENARIRTDTMLAGLKGDELQRAYQIQAGLNDREGLEARKKIIGSAATAGTDVDATFRLATQLQSSGFSRPEESGVLDSFLAIGQASNAPVETLTELAKSMSMYLTATGQEKTPENVMRLGLASRGLFKDTDYQIANLQSFAKAAPFFKNAGISQPETLASLTALRESFEAPEAATFGRNIVSALSTSKAGPKPMREALDRLGLDTDQVDLQGESLSDVLHVLNERLDKLPQAERLSTLKQLFEKETVAGASVLLNAEKSGRLDELMGKQSNKMDFTDAVSTARSGPGFARRQLDAQEALAQVDDEEDALAEGLAKDIRQKNADEAYREARKRGDHVRAAGMLIGETVYNWIPKVGTHDERNALTPSERAHMDRLTSPGQYVLPEDRLDTPEKIAARNAELDRRRAGRPDNLVARDVPAVELDPAVPGNAALIKMGANMQTIAENTAPGNQRDRGAKHVPAAAAYGNNH